MFSQFDLFTILFVFGELFKQDVVFNSEKSVHKVLAQCSNDRGRFFYSLPCSNGRRSYSFLKTVQIIPWDQKDTMHWRRDELTGSKADNSIGVSNCSENGLDFSYPRRYTVPLIDASRTVFIGALHGMITASGLATIMGDLFGTVDKVMLDTDRYHYPIGSARVTFKSKRSYEYAVRTEFVGIRTSHFNKTIQIDPYLYDGPCCMCNFTPQGSVRSINRNVPIGQRTDERVVAFCRDCLTNFCSRCWFICHREDRCNANKLYGMFEQGGFYDINREHIPLIRACKEPNFFSNRRTEIQPCRNQLRRVYNRQF